METVDPQIPIVIATHDDGVGAGLAEMLRDVGFSARVVHAEDKVDDPARGVCSGLIYLGGMRPVSSIDDAMALNREAFAWVKAVGPELSQNGGILVTVQDTGGQFGLSGGDAIRAWSGGLPGLVKTAGLEWPTVAVKAIDIMGDGEEPRSIASLIFGELWNGGPDVEVGFAKDRIRRTVTGKLASQKTDRVNDLSEGAVIVVSGGAGGVTAEVVRALACYAKPRLVLLGRTPLREVPEACQGLRTDADLKRALLRELKQQGENPSPRHLTAMARSIQRTREITGLLAELKDVGVQARYISVDVRDEGALAEVLNEVGNEWGPIEGVVHGAGVLADRAIVEKTMDQFDRVFGTKVLGLRALLAATKDHPLRFLCLFSSIAARSGNVGQCDYAMANEVLNKVAWSEKLRRGTGCNVKAIGWGPWDGGMVTPDLKAYFEARGVPLLSVEEGRTFFLDEVFGVREGVEIVATATDLTPFHSLDSSQVRSV